MGYKWDLPSGNLLSYLLNMVILVSFPIENGDLNHSYVSLPEGSGRKSTIFHSRMGMQTFETHHGDELSLDVELSRATYLGKSRAIYPLVH